MSNATASQSMVPSKASSLQLPNHYQFPFTYHVVNAFIKEELFYTLLPLDPPNASNPLTEPTILRLFIEATPSAAIEASPTIKALPPPLQKIALISHFCFRVCVWEEDDITPAPLRNALEIVASREKVAEKVCEQIGALKDAIAAGGPEQKEAKQSWFYLNPTVLEQCYDGRSPEQGYGVRTPQQEFVLERILQHGAGAEAFEEGGLYLKMDKFEDMQDAYWVWLKTKIVKDRFSVAQHLKWEVLTFLLYPWKSTLKGKDVAKLMNAVYKVDVVEAKAAK